MKKTKAKKGVVGPPVKYPFRDSSIGDVMPIILNTKDIAIRVRCAAHTMSHTHGWRFRTEIRRTDAGKFELTVTRLM